MRCIARSIVSTLAVASAVASAVAAPVAAQSGAEIIERMLTEYERRSQGVENYTLIQDVMGFETVSYFEKEMMDGRPVFRLRSSSAGGVDVGDPGDGGFDEIYTMGDEFARRAQHEGREQIDGYDVHVLEMSDLTGMGFGPDVSPDSDFEPKRGRLFIDADTYAVRRLEFEGEMTNEQGVQEVTMTVDMTDYREVQGMLVAYRTVISIEGLGEAIDPETRAQFEEMQRELENMPPAQRRMVESLMADRLEQFQALLEGDGPMKIETTVREVRVNAGPPGS
jgi:hypothetical protein